MNYIKRKIQTQLAKRFITGASWSIVGSVTSSVITLILSMLLARLMGKQIYGEFVIIQSTLGMVGIFAGFGIGAAAIRYSAELKENNTKKLGHILTLSERTIIGFGILASSGVVIFADFMAAKILNSPKLSFALAISASAIVFTAIDSYQKSVLIGFESMRAFATSTIGGVTLGFPIMIIGASVYGINGAAVALVLNAIIQAGISHYYMVRELKKNNIPRQIRGCLNELPLLWKFALPAMIAGALYGPTHWIAQAILVNNENGYAELATLGIAMQWFSIIMFIPSTAGKVVLPILTDKITNNDKNGARKILIYAISTNAIIAFPVAIGIIIFSQNIMNLYGDDFKNDSFTLILAVLIASLSSILSPIGNLLAASSRMWLGAAMNGLWSLIYIILTYNLVGKGSDGVMIALGIGYIVHGLWVCKFTVGELWKKE